MTVPTFAPLGVSVPKFPATPDASAVSFSLTTPDSVTLEARIWLPDTSKDASGATRAVDDPLRAWEAPVVLIHGPYFRPGVAFAGQIEEGQASSAFYRSQVEFWTRLGFAVVHSESRGSGTSTGCPDFMGPLDAKDWKQVCEYVADKDARLAGQGWKLSGKVLGAGHSYEANLALRAAALKPAGLAALVLSSALPDLYSQHYPGGAPRFVANLITAELYSSAQLLPAFIYSPHDQATWTTQAELVGTSAARVGCQTSEGVSFFTSTSGDKAAPQRSRDWIAGATVDSVVRKVTDIEVPLLYAHGAKEWINSSLGCTDANGVHFTDLMRDAGRTVKTIFGHWRHRYPADDRPDIPAYAAEYWNVQHAFADQYVLGLAAGVNEWPNVLAQDEGNNTYDTSNRKWRWATSVAALGTPTAYKLCRGMMAKEARVTGSIAFRESLGLQWISPAMTENVHLSGVPILKLWADLSTSLGGNIVAYLEELRTDGTRRYLSFGAVSTRHYPDPSTPANISAFVKRLYQIRMLHADWWIKRGSRLVLTLDGARSNDFATPDGANLNPQTRATNYIATVYDTSELLVPIVSAPNPIRVALWRNDDGEPIYTDGDAAVWYTEPSTRPVGGSTAGRFRSGAYFRATTGPTLANDRALALLARPRTAPGASSEILWTNTDSDSYGWTIRWDGASDALVLDVHAGLLAAPATVTLLAAASVVFNRPLAVAISRAGDVVSWSVNGGAVQTAAVPSGNTGAPAGAHRHSFGAGHEGASAMLGCDVAALASWTRALTSAELQAAATDRAAYKLALTGDEAMHWDAMRDYRMGSTPGVSSVSGGSAPITFTAAGVPAKLRRV